MIKKLIKQLFCKHEYHFARNIYGDEINYFGGYRSEWKCKKCGKIKCCKRLYIIEPSHKYLNYLCEEFYKNKYESWQELRKDNLDKIKSDMINNAKKGEYNYHIILTCDEQYDDKYHYIKWFEHNHLKVETKIKGTNGSLYEYEFIISWWS